MEKENLLETLIKMGFLFKISINKRGYKIIR